MPAIEAEDFIQFVRTLEGKELRTKAGRATFTAVALGSRIDVTPLSTGIPRSISRRNVEQVLARYNTTGEEACTGYRALTANSTYLLTLIWEYERARR